MSELQWALLVASMAAVGGVWAFNLWQERKHRQATEHLFAGNRDETAGTRVEPSVESYATATTHDIDETLNGEAEVFDDAAPPEDAREELPEPGFAAWADPVSDCLVRFEVAGGIAASTVWTAQALWRDALTKPLRFLARPSAAEPWQLISEADAGSYTYWLAALQLADRSGAVSDSELQAFLDGMQQLGFHVNAPIVIPNRAEALLTAQRLDEFCAGVDIQFSFHLIESHGGTFVGTKLRGVCEAAGLSLQADGCFHAVNPLGAVEYRLKNTEPELLTIESLRSLATPNVMLILDVPWVADGAAAFDRMVGAARQLERGLGGKLVDAQGNQVADPLIHGIRSKIGELQKLMVDAGIEPGGVLAIRLFS